MEEDLDTSRHIAIGLGGIQCLNDMVDLSRIPDWADTPEVRAQLVEDEAVLREDLYAYAYRMGNNDVEKVAEHFADDAVLKTAAGRYEGIDMIRANYERLLKANPSPLHVWGDVVIRFRDHAEQAYRGAVIHEMWGGFNPILAVGIDIQVLEKRDGRWKIIERAITGESDFKLEPDLEAEEQYKQAHSAFAKPHLQ
jgi:hypothetical protein